MKTRQGFVSNSSSSSFILCTKDLDSNLLERLKGLPDMSDSMGRATGVVWDIETWLGDDHWSDYGLWDIIAKYGNENLILVRESDEGMNGYFGEYDIDDGEISRLAVYEFEYH